MITLQVIRSNLDMISETLHFTISTFKNDLKLVPPIMNKHKPFENIDFLEIKLINNNIILHNTIEACMCGIVHCKFKFYSVTVAIHYACTE